MLFTGLVILFLMSFGGSTMCVGGSIVQLGSSLMIIVMRSVVITTILYKLTISPDFDRVSSAIL